jgi:Tfp pilus assembly protein PilF
LAFHKAVETGDQHPSLYLAHYGLGVSYARLNSMDQAADEFRKTLLLKPDYAPAQSALERIRDVVAK